MSNNRRKRLRINVFCSLLLQLVVFASGMIMPRLYIETYGSKVNGLISSIQQFLGFISFGELGIGAVIQYNLYKPLAQKDWQSVSEIIVSSNRFFRRLLGIIAIYISCLTLLLPLRTNAEFGYVYTASLVVAISFSYIMQYYFGMTCKQLLDADQLSYIRLLPQIIQIVINVVVCSLLIRSKFDVQIVKFVTSILYSIQPLTMYFYAKVHYPHINTRIKVKGEPIKQKWNGLTQHIATVILKDTDVVVLTVCSTLENVSIYAVYNLVINGIEVIIESVVTNITAVFGELFAKEKKEELFEYFGKFETLYHLCLIIVFFCVGRLISPFVDVYTYGIKDVDYKVPAFAIILTLAQWLYCARLPYHIMIKAAGHYRQTQTSAIVEAMVNIIISVSMVFTFGLVGVAIGTAAAMIYRSIYYWIYLKHHILNRPLSYIIKVYGADAVVVVLSWIITRSFELKQYTYLSWIGLAFVVFCITALSAIVVYSLFYPDLMKTLFLRLKKQQKE